MKRLDKKVAIVTGASKGIGVGIAKAMGGGRGCDRELSA
jgi:NAD(P)-dependent dehydrogenase (short-subunit alcohol dehydrogenase family)